MKKNEWIKPAIALLIIFFTYAYFFIVLWIERKTNLIILTAIIGFVSTCIGYYLGYSSGSAKKDDTIANQLKKE